MSLMFKIEEYKGAAKTAEEAKKECIFASRILAHEGLEEVSAKLISLSDR